MRSYSILSMLKWMAIALAFAQISAGAAEVERKLGWATPVQQSANLFQVTPTFYRSAQITQEELALLQSFDIKTVVSLRAFHSDKKILSQSGMQLVRVKIYTWDIDDEQVAQALRAIREAEKQGKVLLHCQHGADRTGLITAMYRVLYQNWDRERALDELVNGGYGYHAMWKNIPDYLRTVDIEKIRRMAGPD